MSLRMSGRSTRGFSLIEAMLVMIVMGIAFFGFGFLYGNIDQNALKADLTILATKLAKEKMEEVIQLKADSGYGAVASQASQQVPSGAWTFGRAVAVTEVSPADFSTASANSGYKKVVVTVAWGAGVGSSISLTTLVTNMVPGSVHGPGHTLCP